MLHLKKRQKRHSGHRGHQRHRGQYLVVLSVLGVLGVFGVLDVLLVELLDKIFFKRDLIGKIQLFTACDNCPSCGAKALELPKPLRTCPFSYHNQVIQSIPLSN